MKIFLDTEFYEYQPSITRIQDESWYSDLLPVPGANAVQLISLGAVREDGAEFYAENELFDWDNVPIDHWIQENVRPHLWGGPTSEKSWERTPFKEQQDYTNLIAGSWTSSRIAQEFYQFACTYALHPSGVATPENVRPEFWGYFCDYDWVVLCGLYGRMVDLPSEFPMYCNDLRQEMTAYGVSKSALPEQSENQHHALADARWVRDAFYALNEMTDGAHR